MPVLRAKLHPPRIPADAVPRASLTARLNDSPERPFSLISAPAGYGKSTLVAQWTEQLDGPVVWLSLDREDQDLRRFLADLVFSIRDRLPETLGECHALLEAAELPSLSSLAGYLSNDFENLDDRLTLVLDDFHRADSPSVSGLIDKLLQHPPLGLHLVIITRRNPALSLARVRASFGMEELHEQDLRFDLDDSRAFIERVAGISVDPKALEELHRELEGWIVGLRLVCLALRGQESPEQYLNKLHGESGRIQDYLTEEVLARQSPAFQDYLMRISVLDRFSASLCDTVANGSGDEEFFQQLKDAKLFIIALDPHDEWFRFHHQFQKLLQKQLLRRSKDGTFHELHSAASGWFDDRGLTDEAISHALMADEIDRATSIAERCRRIEFDEDRWMGVAGWLDMLPADIREQRPALLLAEAWVAFFKLNTARIPEIVSKVESLLDSHPDPDPFWLAELNFFRAVVHFWQGEGKEGKQCCQEALIHFAERRGMLGGEVRLQLALARHLCGESREALEEIEHEFRVEDAADFAYSTRMLAAKAFVHLLSGELQPAAQVSDRVASIAARWPSQYALAWGRLPQGIAHLHACETPQAITAFEQATQCRDFFEKRASVDAYAGKILAYQLSGNPNAVVKTVEEFSAFTRELTDPDCLTAEASFMARLALLQKDDSAALKWARGVSKSPPELGMLFWIEDPAITLIRVFIMAGNPSEQKLVGELLSQTRILAEERHLTCQLIDIVTLQSIHQFRQKQTKSALATLTEALVLSQPGGWIRPFIEAGPEVIVLLKMLKSDESDTSFLNQLIAACNEHGGKTFPTASHPPADRLAEPLTNREFDVLELVAQRLYDKEIAARLSISPETVRTHLKHLFGKLEVTNRRAAAERGKELGLLDGSTRITP